MQTTRLCKWLCTPKNAAITTSAGVLTILAVVLVVHYPRADSPSAKVRTHTFRHAVIDDGINPMNCMSGPWNECPVSQRVRK
jgi:hypothetical protein